MPTADARQSRDPGKARGAGARCSECGGTGFTIHEDESTGRSFARPCACRREARSRIGLRGARIPKRFANCDFASFYKGPEFDPSLERAYKATEAFVRGYSERKVKGEGDGGLLFLGPPGVGKTHLAVAALRSLLKDHGVGGLFADFREMIKSIQSSYDPVSETSEMQVLQPLLRTEVLLLDDLGVCRMTEWVRDVVGHIVSTRYNERRVTLITTNLEDDRSKGSAATSRPRGTESDRRLARRATGRPALADRIGPEVLSRLHEMCQVVILSGEDFRLGVGRHRGRA